MRCFTLTFTFILLPVRLHFQQLSHMNQNFCTNNEYVPNIRGNFCHATYLNISHIFTAHQQADFTNNTKEVEWINQSMPSAGNGICSVEIDFGMIKKDDVSEGVSENKVHGKVVDNVHQQEVSDQDKLKPKLFNESSGKLKEEHELAVEFGAFEYQCTYVFGFLLGGLTVMTFWTLFYESLPDWLITPLDVVMPEECDYAKDVYKMPRVQKLIRSSRLKSAKNGKGTQGNKDGHYSTA